MKEIIITTDNINQRIDKFLKKEVFFDARTTRGEIIRQIKKGAIRVNSKKVKPSYILRVKDEITFNIKKNSQQLIPNKNIKLKIIYEDKNIIVINKPAGISVHPVKLDEDKTLVNGLIYKFPEIKNVGDNPEIRPGIVHRLDKDTSGIMIIAKNQQTFYELKRKFKNREIEKKYWAIVYGKLEKSSVINKPIARAASYKKQVIAGKKTKTKIREAITKYRVLKDFKKYSLLEIIPRTGRIHQIRVHMKSIGHPVLGDEKYKARNIKNITNANRQMLHARNIKFSIFGQNYNFLAKLPEDFSKMLDFLTKKA